MPPIPSRKIAQFRRKILYFYKKDKRDLPWRKTADPYAILLSEIMLQQTQVNRGIAYFEKWLKRWPTVQDLAKADRSDVLREWMGLGYNNRARHIHESAKMICGRFKGDVLLVMEQYKELPGIGPYTAATVRIFSNNEDITAVDTNIRRILIHEFKLDEKIKDKELWALAKMCLPKGKSREWHNALMDYGATHLTSRKTGIRPKGRQSKFEGSDRQVRAAVLRFILSHSQASFAQLKKHTGCEKERLRAILDKMQKDNILISGKGMYGLSPSDPY